MPIVDVRNIPTVVEFAPENKVVEFTEEAVTAEVVVGPTVVEFSWGELVPGPGLRGGGVFEGTVHIDQDIPSLPNNSEPIDPEADYLMLYDASSNLHVKVLAQLGAGGIAEIPWATREETDAGVLTDKALNPDVGAYAYDRFRWPGQHSAGKGTQTVTVTPVSGVVTIDGDLSNVFYLTLESDVEFANPINPINGQTINIHLKQDVTGGHAITGWGSQWKFVNRIDPVLSTNPNANDLLSCQWNEVDGIMECSFLPNYGSGYVAPDPPSAADLVFVNVGAGNNVYRDTVGLNVNFRTFAAEGDLSVRTEGDQIIYSYTAPIAVDYSAVPFLIVGDPAEYPSLLYSRQIVAGIGIAIDTLTEGAFTISSDLVPIPPGGTTAQVLSKLSDNEYDVAWVDPAAGSFNSPMTTKGDLITRTATEDTRLPVGTNGQILSADSAEPTGLKWIVAPEGGGGGGGGGGNPSIIATQAANQSVVSSVVYVNTDLSLALEANTTYVIRANIHSNGLTTNYLNFRLNYTGTYSLAQGIWLVGRIAGSTSQWTDRFAALPAVIQIGTTADHITYVDLVITTTTAGTFTLQMAQNTSSATAVTIYAGSYIQAERIETSWTGNDSVCVVARIALQNFSTAASAVSWDTEEADTDGYFTAVNPTRITFPASGWYTLLANVWQSIDPDDMQTLWFAKNGAAYSNTQTQTRMGAGSTAVAAGTNLSETAYYAAGDYIELWVDNRSGTSTAYARMSVFRISGPTGPQGPQGLPGFSSNALTAYQSTDVVITSNATYQDTQLQLPLAPGTYFIDLSTFDYNHATPDMKRRLTFTGTGTVKRIKTQVIIDGNSSYFNGTITAFDVDSLLTSTAAHHTRYWGVIDVTVGGTLKWQVAQNVSSATAIAHYAGGSLIAFPLTDLTVSNIDAVIAADSPRGYWKLDEASGNFADSSGNGYTATITGAPVTTYQWSAVDGLNPTRKTPIANSGGQTNYASAGNMGLTLPITTYTIEAWGRWSTSGIIAAFGASGETAATNFAGQLLVTSTGLLSQFWEYGAGTNAPTITAITDPILDARLHHVAVVKDAATLSVKYYVDGKYCGGGTYTGGQEHTDGSSGVFSFMGTPGDGTAAADGQYSGVAFYTTALSEARIQARARALGLLK